MKKCFLLILALSFQFGFTQQNLNWKGYFSYNQIKDISQSDTKLFAAAENAIFTKNTTTTDLETINTINGLSGQTISAVYHSANFKKTLVGYDNGLMIVINNVDGSMLYVVDIINKNIPSNIKKINHFMEYDGIVYVSCDFGIVQYKLATLEFGDTYFIGPNGQEIKIYQTCVYNGDLYAVTQNNGIKKAAINNPNLNDFAQWQSFDLGYWSGLVTFNNQLIAINTNTILYKYNGTSFQQIANIGQSGLDLRANADNLIVTSQNHVYIYNTSLVQVVHIQSAQIPDTPTFTCATTINGNIYIGTNETGIVSATIANPFAFGIIMPNGPVRNNIFSINSSSSNLWAVYGDYTSDYDPAPPLYQGISKYSNSQWTNIPYSKVHNPGSEVSDLVRVTVNPNNENQIFVSSYYSGLLKFEDDQLITVYNKTNSGLETIFPTDPPDSNIRIEQSAYDRSGNLWLTNGLVKNGLKVFRANGQWQSFDTSTILSNYLNNRFGRMVIDKSGVKWICTFKDGLVAFSDDGATSKKITEGETLGNLPYRDVRALAIDNRNQLWIGTTKGLRVLPSVSSFSSSDDQMKTNAIIILEDGLAQELLYEQSITDIAVNGSNQKWIGTADSGVFLFSSDGQQTIYHFTKDNSPLPSNTVNDVDINAVSGEVFFATDKGMVSFQGTSTRPADDLANVYVYPNPVRPEFVGTVKIAGLISKANIKITDIEGNLVYETTSEGGTIEWDTTAFGKYRVASGVYMIFVAAEDGSDTTVKKVMIIR